METPEKQEAESKLAQITAERAIFSGPLPPPSALAKYEEVLPGSAERIMSMAEKSQRHVHDMDMGQLRYLRIGQALGFVIALVCLALTAVFGLTGQPWLAGVIGGTTLVGLVTVFVIGKYAGHNQ